MPLRISTAGHSDEERLLPLMGEFYAGERLDYREEVLRAALRQLWSDPALGRVCLMHHGETLAGYAVLTFGFSLEFRGRDALVDELYVRPAHRGRGHGAECLRWMEAVCRAEGIHALHLEVDRSNPGAKRLYHRVGYRDHDRYLLTKWLEE